MDHRGAFGRRPRREDRDAAPLYFLHGLQRRRPRAAERHNGHGRPWPALPVGPTNSGS